MIRGITMKIGGASYIVPPLNLGALETFGDGIYEYQRGTDGLARFPFVVDLLHAALLRNYSTIRREQIACGIDLANADDIFHSIMKVSGIPRTVDELKKVLAGR
jgi:hypothetical protein